MTALGPLSGPPPGPPAPEAGRRHAGAAGDLPAGPGGQRSAGGGAQGQGDLSARADRFAAALAAGAQAAPAGAAAVPLVPPPDSAAAGDGSGAEAATGFAAAGVPVPPPALAAVAEPAPLLPAGTAAAEAVADITRRVAAELRAAEAPAGPLASGGTVKLALDLGRTALGITGLRLEIGPQTLVLVLTVPPGGAAHDLPQAVQALAQALTARHPHRAVRIETEGGAGAEATADGASGPNGFDPFRPWSRGTA